MLRTYLHISVVTSPVRETKRLNVLFYTVNANSNSLTFGFKSRFGILIIASGIAGLAEVWKNPYLRITRVFMQQTIEFICIRSA